MPPTHVTPWPVTESTVFVSSFVVNAQTQTSTSHSCIEEISDNDTAIHFYTGFCDYRTLIVRFEFLGKPVKMCVPAAASAIPLAHVYVI